MAPTILFWFSIPAAAQISPGPLSQAHQSLSGPANCSTCHSFSSGEPTFKCLECHTEIALRITARRGLHASYNLKPGSSQACARCHSDHNGEDFPLIKWNITAFDHRQTGYALEGRHAGLGCYRCHTVNYVAQSELPNIKVKDVSKTFLGVSPNCSTCHRDQHEARLGPHCLQCHDFNDWKTIRIRRIDHSKTRYPLIGLHAQVACQQCHTPGSGGKPRYVGIAFGLCTDCHTDPHHGGFAQNCHSCHSTVGWKRISTVMLNQAFDHSQTKFPLLGKHAVVDCVCCHAGGDFKKPLAFQKCADCHKPDPHRGQFARRADAGECASCHTTDGFRPAKFGLQEHAATAYPLEGKHAALQCGQCHIPKGKDTLYKVRFQHCTDCHSDPHAAQFARAPYLNQCEHCHNSQRFVPSTFTLVRHQKTRLVLSGGHVAVVCGDCHRPAADFKPKPTTLYHWRKLACTTCHADPHKGQFERLMHQAGLAGKPLGCEVCHSSKSWQELSRFNHSKTSFPLLGTHQSTVCIDCHKPEAAITSISKVDFTAAPTQCDQCHKDIHGRQFAKAGATQCAECHNNSKWKPSLFDHETRAAFALQSAHRDVRCELCHLVMRTIDDKSVLFYKPAPKECSSCHRPGVAKN